MKITAAMVKELRERTGSGMMECKKALVEAEGDLALAVNQMRKSGLANADKKSGRIAAEGLICIKTSENGRQAAMVEVNCETDFVTRGADFNEFVSSITNKVLISGVDSMETLNEMCLEEGGVNIEEKRRELVAKIGENIHVRRCVYLASDNGSIATYLHGNRIGVLVEMSGSDELLNKDIAMHIAASKPLYVDAKDISAELIQKEREIFVAQAEASGKPANIIEKMVDGRMTKYLNEVTLLGQAFVKDPDVKVGSLLNDKSQQVIRFTRFEVGEGIEKKKEDFAEEVMAQARGV